MDARGIGLVRSYRASKLSRALSQSVSRKHRVGPRHRRRLSSGKGQPVALYCDGYAIPSIMGKHRNPTASSFSLPLVMLGHAPSPEDVMMVEITLFIHSDGRSPNYYAMFTHPVTGKTCQFSCGTPDREAAHAYAVKSMPRKLQRAYDESVQGTRRRNGTHLSTAPAPRTTVASFLTAFPEEHLTRRGTRLAKRTKKTYSDTFSQFRKFICEKCRKNGRCLDDATCMYHRRYMHEITEAECRAFILTSPQPSDRTAQRHYTVLRGAFAEAVRQQFIQVNPFDRFRAPVPVETADQIAERCFTDEQFATLLAVLPSTTHAERRLRNMLVLAMETGMRFGEFRHARLDWIDKDSMTITVQSSRDFNLKTVAAHRTIPLSDEALEVIAAQAADNETHRKVAVRTSPFLFPNERGVPLSEAGVWLPFSKARRRVFKEKLPRIHGLRHNFVTRLSMEGMSDRMIMDLVGHEDAQMVRRYSHMGRRLVAPAREALNRSRRNWLAVAKTPV